MRVLFLGLNYTPEMIGIAVYSTGLCQGMAESGHSVTVVAGKPYYPQWRTFPGYKGGWRRSREQGVEVIRCPLYVPSSPSGPRRILHHISFGLAALGPMLWSAVRHRPDLVITVAPSLVAAPVAWLAAKLAGARTWLHVQDFEVEAALATGLLDSRSPAVRLVRWAERRIISLFDNVSSISREMCTKLIDMGLAEERVVELRNWADIEAVRPLSKPSEYRTAWRISTPHVALYSGNIANKQGIEIVIAAARRLQHRSDLTFVICGQGPNRADLEASTRDLDNVRFYDLQPTDRLRELLGLASVHLLPQKAEAADLVLPSKLTNMLASGRPVVATAAPGTGLAREVGGCGIITPPGDEAAFATAIEELLDDEERRGSYAVAARRRAEEVWEPHAILRNFLARAEREL